MVQQYFLIATVSFKQDISASGFEESDGSMGSELSKLDQAQA